MEQRRRQRHKLPEILVVCGAEDQKVWIWDLQTKENLQTLYGHTDVILAIAVRIFSAFSPNTDSRCLGSPNPPHHCFRQHGARS